MNDQAKPLLNLSAAAQEFEAKTEHLSIKGIADAQELEVGDYSAEYHHKGALGTTWFKIRCRMSYIQAEVSEGFWVERPTRVISVYQEEPVTNARKVIKVASGKDQNGKPVFREMVVQDSLRGRKSATISGWHEPQALGLQDRFTGRVNRL